MGNQSGFVSPLSLHLDHSMCFFFKPGCIKSILIRPTSLLQPFHRSDLELHANAPLTILSQHRASLHRVFVLVLQSKRYQCLMYLRKSQHGPSIMQKPIQSVLRRTRLRVFFLDLGARDCSWRDVRLLVPSRRQASWFARHDEHGLILSRLPLTFNFKPITC